MSLEIVRALGLVTIQDVGRPGRMHEALPPGGALVRELYDAANAAAGNAVGAPAVEVLGVLVVRALADVTVAIETGRVLRAGDELEISAAPGRVAYLALRGGVDAPLVLGGRGTQLSAGIGARLRTGDLITAASWPRVEPSRHPALDGTAGLRVRVIAGPDGDAFPSDALALLTSAEYRIFSDQRSGVGIAARGPCALPAWRATSSVHGRWCAARSRCRAMVRRSCSDRSIPGDRRLSGDRGRRARRPRTAVRDPAARWCALHS